ncbi:MAG: RDD family protein [Lachnospiraceae bacterium]|nr:RDD family protein [Lachnospiraceae bacterium]
MKKEVNGTVIEIAPNSKPYLLKRILADGVDTVLLFGLFMLFTALIMKTPISSVYHRHFDRYSAIENETAEKFGNDAEAVSEALNGNDEFRNERFAANLHGYLLKALAGFLAEAIVLLLVPLINRNRATPGKLMTGIMLFNERKMTRALWYQVVFRFLFVFLFDSMALYLLTGVLTFLLVPVIRLMEMLLNKKNKTLCDYMTGAMVIEKLSYDGLN